MKLKALLLCGCIALAACSPKAEEAPAPEAVAAPALGVQMDVDTQSRMGVHVASVAQSSAPRAAEGYARILDVGPLAALDSEVGAAVSAAAASRAEYQRLQALAAADQAASARAVEAARAQAEADDGRASLALRRVGLEWGPGLAQLSEAQRSSILTDVSRGRAALARVDSTASVSGARSALLEPEDGGAPIEARILGPAGAADARLQSAGVLVLVRGAPAQRLPAGRLIRAQLQLAGEAEAGFVIPSSAIVRVGDAPCVYVRIGADHFERRDVSSGRAIADGWFVASGFQAGDEIVTDGAASVLAAERGPVEAE